MHVTIVGAGIIGIQTAHALLDDGHAVTLIDPDGLGQRTSRGNQSRMVGLGDQVRIAYGGICAILYTRKHTGSKS